MSTLRLEDWGVHAVFLLTAIQREDKKERIVWFQSCPTVIKQEPKRAGDGRISSLPFSRLLVAYYGFTTTIRRLEGLHPGKIEGNEGGPSEGIAGLAGGGSGEKGFLDRTAERSERFVQ